MRDPIFLPFLKRLALPLSALVCGLLVSVIMLFSWMTAEQDRLSFANEQRLATAAVTARTEFVHRNLGDYAIWDDIVRNLVIQHDLAWADANVGPYLFAIQGYEYSLVINDKGRTIYASAGAKRTARLTAILPDGTLGRLIDGLRHMKGSDRRTVIVTRVDGVPALLGAAAIVPSSGAVKLPAPHYLLLVKKLDRATIAALEREYGLHGLHIATEGTGIPLLDNDGHPIAMLAWQPLDPGLHLRQRTWPLLFALLILTGVGLWLVLSRSWGSVRDRAAAQDAALESAREAAAVIAERAEIELRQKKDLEAAVARAHRENALLNTQAARERARAEQAEANALDGFANHLEMEIGAAAAALSVAANALSDAADVVGSSAELSSGSAARVAIGSQSTRTHLERVAGASAAITQSASRVATNVATNADAAACARNEARAALSRLDELNEAVDRIGGMVGAIGELTRKSHLLAVNTAIEAARAGAAGQGFTVVADEVRRLAARTRELLGEANDHVEAVRASSEQAGRMAARVDALLGPMADAASEITIAVEEQLNSMRAIGGSFVEVTHLADDLVGLSETADRSARDGFGAAAMVRSTADRVEAESLRLNEAVQAVQNRLRKGAGAVRAAA